MSNPNLINDEWHEENSGNPTLAELDSWIFPEDVDVSASAPVAIADVAGTIIEQKPLDGVKYLYDMGEDARIAFAVEKAKFFDNAAMGQLFALDLLQFVNHRVTERTEIAAFSEKIRRQLVDRISSFGSKAYPLTEKQFSAAVKAAW